jgi:hypothetical protein
MPQIMICWESIFPQHVSGVFTPIIRRSDCVTLPMVSCPVVAVVMLESRVARCVHCEEEFALTPCNPTLQHHNIYNRIGNRRQ